MSPNSQDSVAITSIEFKNYKALRDYSLRLQHMNVLVGPNNCGKSTVIGAFRALWAALRRARGRSPVAVEGPKGKAAGYWIEGDALPISVENIHSDYARDATTITFRLSNKNKLHLFFPVEGTCSLVLDTEIIRRGARPSLRRDFPIDVAIVPVLGPVEHNEELVKADTVQRYQMTHRASRHFRNYWYSFPEGFDEFASLLKQTWPEMEVQRPEIASLLDRLLAMYCLERRMTRELYWAGFGFQVWCQMLTHMIRGKGSTIFVIDEPEIYLHADLQRQLVTILRELGPDILIATHSTEIMAEADPSEIVLIDKNRRAGERLRTVESLQSALEAVGSVQNITLARLSKSRKVLFVEDEYDYLIMRRFAGQLGYRELASGMGITPVKSGGFSSWEKVSVLGWGLGKTLGLPLHLAAVYDRDYYCVEELAEVESSLRKTVQLAHIHGRKEIENYLLLPEAIARAAAAAIADRARRSNEATGAPPDTLALITTITERYKNAVQAQYVGRRLDFLRRTGKDASTIAAEAISEFEGKWNDLRDRLAIVPGKEVLAELRQEIQERHQVSLTDYRIITACRPAEIPQDLRDFLADLDTFRSSAL